MIRGILIVVAALAGALFGAFAAGPAQAHAAYKDSDPPDEATISQAPSEIWAEFTEPVSDASYLKVFSPCGDQVDDENSRADGYRIYITMSGNTSGEYRVEFFANSSIDTHNTRGEFTFTVTDGKACPGADTEKEVVKNERERNARDQDSNVGATTGGSDTSGGAVAAGDSRGQRRDSDPRHARHRDHGTGRKPARADRGQQPIAAPGDPNSQKDADRSNIFTGIPIGGLLIALAFAALIGAAGGFIYAGIMGYHRTGS